MDQRSKALRAYMTEMRAAWAEYRREERALTEEWKAAVASGRFGQCEGGLRARSRAKEEQFAAREGAALEALEAAGVSERMGRLAVGVAVHGFPPPKADGVWADIRPSQVVSSALPGAPEGDGVPVRPLWGPRA